MMSQTMDVEGGASGQDKDRKSHSPSDNRQNFWKVIMVKFFDRRTPLGNWTFFIFCFIAFVSHSLFYELPEIKKENDNRKCVQINKVRRKGSIGVRSGIDFIYFIYSIVQLCADLKGNADSKENAADSKGNAGLKGNADLKGNPKKSWLLFLVDLFIILPIPQALLISSDPKIFVSALPFLLVQVVPRIIRMFPRLRHSKREIISRRIRNKILAFDENIGRHLEGLLFACVVFIVFLYYYLTAGSVFGSLWYYFAIKKITTCWKKKAVVLNSKGDSFYCDGQSSVNFTLLDGLCPMETLNKTIYDFGIYGEALQSDIVWENKIPFNLKRLTYCLRWGMQNLSCFGQGLQPSTAVGEDIFVLSITIVGVLLLVFSVGFSPMIIESKFTELDKMASTRKETRQEIRQWQDQPQSLGKLSGALKQKIEKYLLDNEVQITKGIDVENLLNYLSNDLKTEIKRELCLPCLQKVQVFRELEEASLKELCNYVKLVSYTAHTRIVHMGDPIDKMIFVLQGELWAYTTNNEKTSRPDFLGNDDFFGNELLDWIENSPSSFNLPTSNRAIVAHKDVEAFALMACDLKNISPKERTTQPVEPQ